MSRRPFRERLDDNGVAAGAKLSSRARQRSAGEPAMWEMIAGWNAGPVIGLTAVVGFLLWMIVLSVADSWKRVRRAELDAEQKREYLQRGLSIDEIERLLRAGRKPAKGEQPANERVLEANLASVLVQY